MCAYVSMRERAEKIERERECVLSSCAAGPKPKLCDSFCKKKACLLLCAASAGGSSGRRGSSAPLSPGLAVPARLHPAAAPIDQSSHSV